MLHVVSCKCTVIVHYSIFFLPFFVYIVYEYVSIYKKRNPENLINIKADPFLEQFLKEIKDRHPAEGYILSIIIFYVYQLLYLY